MSAANKFTDTITEQEPSLNSDFEPLESTVAELTKELFISHPEQLLNPDTLRQALDQRLLAGLHKGIESAAKRWAEELVGAERYQRDKARRGYLNGLRNHTIKTSIGPITVSVPRPRTGLSRPPWIAELKKTPQKVISLARSMWLKGMSTRRISAISSEVIQEKVSHTQVGTWVRDVADEVLHWLNEPIERDFAYLFFDGIAVPVQRETSRMETFLVALGVTAEGHKQILDVMLAPSESLDSWSTIIGRLKTRGLNTDKLRLAISDGHLGLIAAIKEHLPRLPRQRCTTHKIRNIIGKCSKELKSTLPAEASRIFQAPSKTEARERAERFCAAHKHEAPQVVESLKDDLEACFTFYDFDANKWASLRTTNVIERTNRELRRKFREIGSFQSPSGAMRIAVQMAQELNTLSEGKIIVGFDPNAKQRKKGRRRRF